MCNHFVSSVHKAHNHAHNKYLVLTYCLYSNTIMLDAWYNNDWFAFMPSKSIDINFDVYSIQTNSKARRSTRAHLVHSGAHLVHSGHATHCRRVDPRPFDLCWWWVIDKLFLFRPVVDRLLGQRTSLIFCPRDSCTCSSGRPHRPRTV